MAKKMTKKELDTYRDLLLQKRNALTGTMNSLQNDVDDAGSVAGSGDSADMGADTFEQDFALSLMENEVDVIQMIDEALGRIEKGEFGNCVECERRILKARLNALPWTSYCIDCQRKAEAS